MGCKNVGDSNKKNHKQKEMTHKEEEKVIKKEGEKTTKVTKQVIETVNEDGTVVTKTIIQKSSGDEIKDNGKAVHYQEEPSSHRNNNKKKERKKSSSSSDSDKGKGGSLNLNKFIQEALQIHNQLRSKHKAPPLKINSELNKIAQKYAEKIAKTNNFSHSDNQFKGDNLGENLYMCGGYLITGKGMSQSWYDEIKDYDFRKATFNSHTGHFTQLVWAGSTEVGFGAAQAKDGSYYGVANYYPAGNFLGEFDENVKKA